MTKSQKAKAEREARYAEARAIVAAGKCPNCGNPLIRNLALTGWWQCAGFADPGFRKTGFENLPKCGFQAFTE